MFYSQLYSWMSLLVLGSYLVNKGAALKCYVCGGEEEDSFPCSEFQLWDGRYSKECEGNNNSCLLSKGVIDGKVLSRSCEKMKLNDCKIANSIQYCYCSKNFCNELSPTDAKELEESEEDIQEDSIEGSGIRNEDRMSTTHRTDIFEKKPSTDKIPVNLDKVVESNIIPSDRKYSSSCVVLPSNFHLPISVLSIFYIVKQY